MKVGVFDSGVGGLSVANAIKLALPELEVILREDREHIPYGLRQPQEILGFVLPILNELSMLGCEVIVIACNTVSTTLITQLRQKMSTPLVALEPMVKPAAALTKTGVIAVCATPATLNSERYAWLKNEYAKDVTILEPDCSDWALMIEGNQVERQTIEARIHQVLSQSADVIVLACTHYHWIEEDIRTMAGADVTVLQPEQAIITQLQRVIAQLG